MYQSISDEEQAAIDAQFESTVSMSDVHDAVKGIAVDSAAGPDRLLVRVIKQEVVTEVLAVIAAVLLEMNAKKEHPLPSALQLARTVLIHNGVTSQTQTTTGRFPSVRPKEGYWNVSSIAISVGTCPSLDSNKALPAHRALTSTHRSSDQS
ncbi:hypothetical protein RvY_05442 [Ramazzottius varieornatus]|uniref:Uncharacterized protein n=1 Tax=Ramazzottius varieornatus TaxID=947166 RepID=A0A1D1V0M8_RAMVA|nr:hypothetical protein RvY_05442 [Ramazzottius varieornatus]